MKRTLLAVLIIATVVVIVAACEKFIGETTSPPTITSQGFRIEAVQEGPVGQFGSLRVRVECPAGIQNLRIKERSYDIDLASTPERKHFQFFDLNRRVLLKKDVTLDFQSYINQKLQQDGEYTFTIEATDEQDQIAKATIRIRLQESSTESEAAQPEPPRSETEPGQQSSVPVKTSHFEIQRIGLREIEGEETFGLAWKTVDTNKVTIRVRKMAHGASKLASLSVGDYDSVVTQDNLKEVLAFANDQEHIDIDTANNAAAGEVLGIVYLGKPYVIKSSQSMSAFSDAGTTVTLTGEYKYQ